MGVCGFIRCIGGYSHDLGQEQNYGGRAWSLVSWGNFSVKSLLTHLSPSSPMDKAIYKALWNTSNPRRVNILFWIMAFNLPNCSLIMQRKFPSKCLLPLMCPQYLKDNEDLLCLFLLCPYSFNCWKSIFSILKVYLAFD